MKRKIVISLILSGIIFLLGFTDDTFASAGFYLTPSSGTYYNGSSFTVRVYIGSTEPINAVEADISYDSSKLAVIACGAVNSTFEMIADSSCPSITVGTTGSYTGGGAQVAYITFRATATGSATVSVSGRTAMSGSSVATSGYSKTYSIVQYNPVASAPSVVSASHPDSESWYSEKTIELSWNKESYVTNFSYELDQASDTEPDSTSDSTGTGVNLEVESDGTWYFHIKAKSAGGWSDTAHYKLQIDSTDPEFTANPSYEDKGDLQPTISFEANDSGSGIDHYEVSLDEADPVEAESPFKTEVLDVGNHTCVVTAYDKAENTVEYTLSLNVGELQPPVITELIVGKLYIGSINQRITIKGTAPSDSKIYIQISSEGGINAETEADADGNWEYVYEGELSDGSHEVRVMTEVSGIQSSYSEAYLFSIGEEGGFSLLPRTGGSTLSSALFLVGGLLFGMLIAGGVLVFIAYKKGLLNSKKKGKEDSTPTI